METEKIVNLRHDSKNEFPKFATKKCMLLTVKQLLIVIFATGDAVVKNDNNADLAAAT